MSLAAAVLGATGFGCLAVDSDGLASDVLLRPMGFPCFGTYLGRIGLADVHVETTEMEMEMAGEEQVQYRSSTTPCGMTEAPLPLWRAGQP